MYHMSRTVAVNDDPQQPRLSRADVWRGLVLKADNALPFVPQMTRCDVLERGDNWLLREITFRGEDARERVTLFPQQRVHFVFAGVCELNPGDDHFQFLRQHALDLEELVFIFLTKLLGARQAEVVVELLPALQIVFDLEDQVVQFFVFHKVEWLAIILATPNVEQGK